MISKSAVYVVHRFDQPVKIKNLIQWSMTCLNCIHFHLVQAGGEHSLVTKVMHLKVKLGGSGNREKGSPSFTGLEHGDRSDRALVITLGSLCAHC